MDVIEGIRDRSGTITLSSIVAALPSSRTRRPIYQRKHTLRAIFRVASFLGVISCYAAYNYVGTGTLGNRTSANSSTPGGTLDRRLRTGGADAVELQRRQQREAFAVGGDDVEGTLGGSRQGRRLSQAEDVKSLNVNQKDDESVRKEEIKKRNEQLVVESGVWSASGISSSPFKNILWDPSAARELEDQVVDEVVCDQGSPADPPALATAYFFGVLYLFLALAVVCDEFFVPALEEMASDKHLNLSMDVAGATLMAAGGSAPELFTAFVATFKRSDIGIGTIVGSAVFNVLFVIGMCSLLSKDVLTLTWWPLFRDSSYYAVGLVVLSVFVGLVSPGQIEWWEATILFIMYIGYVLLMYFNRKLYKLITGKEFNSGMNDMNGEEEVAISESAPEEAAINGAAEHASNGNANGAESEEAKATLSTGVPVPTPPPGNARRVSQNENINFLWPGTFRAGVLKMLLHPESWVDSGGIGIVATITGDADQVFKKVDVNGDGSIDKIELGKLFEELDANIPEAELDAVFSQLDSDGNGEISQKEFLKWYTNSEELITAKIRPVFNRFDADMSGTISREELRNLLESLEPRVTEADLDEAIQAMNTSGEPGEITYEEFSNWYIHSIIYQRQHNEIEKKIETDSQGICQALLPPSSGEGCFAWTKYIIVLPLVALLTFTIPDVRRPGLGKWCYAAFFLSIGWIGFFSFFMVEWTTILGDTIGIPPVIMGLTFLAAGTSVPDLLSSVIVARMGEGDMAVSSSIGSNIFDILVGLPLPWIIFTAWPSTPEVVEIGADGIWISIFTLIGMLVAIIAIIHCQGWKMTKSLGAMMFVLYFAFLVMSVTLEVKRNPCFG